MPQSNVITSTIRQRLLRIKPAKFAHSFRVTCCFPMPDEPSYGANKLPVAKNKRLLNIEAGKSIKHALRTIKQLRKRLCSWAV